MSRRKFKLCTATIAACLATTALASAQTAGPDERVKPNGAVSQKLAVTPAQKTAIHNAVMEQHRGAPAQPALTLSVGAAVPASVELRDLPERAGIDMPWTDSHGPTRSNTPSSRTMSWWSTDWDGSWTSFTAAGPERRRNRRNPDGRNLAAAVGNEPPCKNNFPR